MDTIESLKHKIQDYDYVSFDVFDTLLFRTVPNAYDQLKLIPIIMEKGTGGKLKGVVKNRLEAEGIARRENPNSDVTLSMIYEKMPYPIALCEKLQRIECDVELKCCYPNSVMVDILNWCKAQGKHVIITTDMYLPRKTLEAMLEKIGVAYERMFISSEEGATKNHGELFDIILKKLDISPRQIVHIGDNPVNDIQKAKEHGIESIERVENCMTCLTYGKTKAKKISEQHIKCLIERGLQSFGDVTPEIRIGYSIVGPLLYEFCEWLHNQKVKKGLDYLLFVAREGYLIKEFYDLMFPDEGKTTKYVRLNKNLLRLPLLKGDNPVENFLNGSIVRKDYTWELIFHLLRCKNHDAVIQELKDNRILISIKDSVSREDLINGKYNDVLDALFRIQEQTIDEQEQLLIEYLSQNFLVGKKVGLVNNSFNGNGQHMVETFMNTHNMKSDIFGLQFYTTEKCIGRLHDRCAGFVTQAQLPHFVKVLISASALILEHFMFEHQGTALYYQKQSDGTVDAVCEKPRHEQEDYRSIDLLQRSALRFVKDAKETLLVPLDGWGYYAFYNMLRHPIMEDVSFIGHLWDDDDDGDRQILNLSENHQSYMSIFKFEKRNEWPIGNLKGLNMSASKINLFYWRWLLGIYKRSVKHIIKDLKYISNI